MIQDRDPAMLLKTLTAPGESSPSGKGSSGEHVHPWVRGETFMSEPGMGRSGGFAIPGSCKGSCTYIFIFAYVRSTAQIRETLVLVF